MTPVIIIGAAGRMGQRLVALTATDDDLTLQAAIERGDHPDTGTDAGTVAGAGELGVPVTSDLAAALESASAGVAIAFSAPDTAADQAASVAAAGWGIVIGTTGLTDADKARLRELAGKGARIVCAPNMSVGVNLLFQLASQAASTLGDAYDIEVIEMHHNQKKDAPSGTAERLGEILAEARGLDYSTDTRHGRQGMVGERSPGEIGMHSMRGGDVVGDHTVVFAAGGERLELTHRASSRDTFALGALRAAKFIASADPGLYDMQDVLGLK